MALYSSVVTTAPGGKTRIHHHGDCETSIYIVAGRARYTWGPSGLEHEMEAGAGDFVYIPAGEIHVEENASAAEPLVVVLSRNCPDSHVVYVDGGPDGSDDVPGPVLKHWTDRSLPDLLEANGLAGMPEEPFPNDGWSGAFLTSIRRGDDRFVLKRTSWATDWIARATRDRAIREAFVAARPAAAPGRDPRAVPGRGGGRQPGRDPDARPVGDPLRLGAADRRDESSTACSGRLAPPARGLRAAAGRDFPWCPLARATRALTPRAAERYRADGLVAGERFLAGWDAFDRLAQPRARELVGRLSADAGSAPRRPGPAAAHAGSTAT